VALAEQLKCALLTCDAKLVGVPGAGCGVDLIG
jgi:predicted nucleic acid-binding protein